MVLASHQCGPGSVPGVDVICGLSLLLVLSFPPRGFSPGTPVLPSPQKPIFPNSNSTRNKVDEEPLCGCATSKSLFIYLLFRMPTKRFLKIHSNSHITLSFLFIWNWNGKYLHTLPLFHRKPFPFSRPKRRKNHTLWDGVRHRSMAYKREYPQSPPLRAIWSRPYSKKKV